jgi:enediyne biosynthesis protein E4
MRSRLARPSVKSTLLTILVLLLCEWFGVASSRRDSLQVPIFREAGRELGLRFDHFIGATGEFYMPEIMGSGVALFDYDGDGDLDAYFLQGDLLNKKKGLNDSLFPKPPGPLSNRLFRNYLVEEGKLKFSDVTAQAGVGGKGYGMGAAVGDYDNDGDRDLYVTNFGHNILYRNNGDGTFTDVTADAGVNDFRLSTGAAFVDYDNDGDLDLFVLSYVDFTLEGNKDCWDSLGTRDYCLPAQYKPLPARLFRNEGAGRFVDVTRQSGVGSATGAGLGVTCADFNSDGWIDLYVANDGTPNLLWINKGDGTFEEKGLLAGAAYNENALVSAGMGVTAGDFDNDGDDDLFVTNLNGETNTLYVNDGLGNFHDATRQFKLAVPSFPYTGFGTEWFDYDNDGNLDLFSATGAVRIVESLRGTRYPYHQKNQLYRNEGNGGFAEVTSQAGPALALSEVSRGAAFGDVDNDGDIDIAVSNNNGPARLLLNQAGSRNHWLEVCLERTQGNRQGLGSRVAVLRRGQKPLWRRVHTDGSYLSASDCRVHFGLGQGAQLEGVVVQWLGGRLETWEDVSADKFLTLREGSGRPWSKEP